MSLSKWLRDANKLGKGKSKAELISQLGEPPGNITSNGKGGWQKRSGDRRAQKLRRRNFDTTSTSFAANEARKLQSYKQRINGEAKMFELEPTQTEHLADQDDAQAIQFGAPGDPDNKLLVKTSDARFKDSVKQTAGKEFAVVNNPAEESIKVVPKRFYDPLADLNLLPGFDIKTPADLIKFAKNKSFLLIDEQLQRGFNFQGGQNALDVPDVIYGALNTAAARGGPVVDTAVDAFYGAVDEPVRQATGNGVFEQIPNGSAKERKAKNGKVNGDMKKNNGHNGNGNGHAITNEVLYTAKKLSNGQLPYNGD
jgi:hypothetical protein